jgi:hypothetical protein
MMSRFLVADDGDVPAEPELPETDAQNCFFRRQRKIFKTSL